MKKKEKVEVKKTEKTLVPNPNMKLTVQVSAGDVVITDHNSSANNYTGKDWNEIQKALKAIIFA